MPASAAPSSATAAPPPTVASTARRLAAASAGAVSPVTRPRARTRAASARRTRTATAAAASGGRTVRGAACGLLSTAASPARPNAPRTSNPAGERRSSSSPATAAPRAMTSPMPTSSAVLSAVPNKAMAVSFTGAGTASITTDPTAETGDREGLTIAASSSPALTPRQAATTPAAAAQARCRPFAADAAAAGVPCPGSWWLIAAATVRCPAVQAAGPAGTGQSASGRYPVPPAAGSSSGSAQSAAAGCGCAPRCCRRR